MVVLKFIIIKTFTLIETIKYFIIEVELDVKSLLSNVKFIFKCNKSHCRLITSFGLEEFADENKNTLQKEFDKLIINSDI